MIVILGESGCGKSTVEKVLVESYGYKKIISYTTRPIRHGEFDGIDYHFITQDEFIEKQKNGFFVEVGIYNDWYYGTAKEDCTDDKVAVVTPHGMRQLKLVEDINVISFYIDVPRRDRLIALLKRGDNIEEAYRRSLSDIGQFDGIRDEVDYVLENPGYVRSPGIIAASINMGVTTGTH